MEVNPVFDCFYKDIQTLFIKDLPDSNEPIDVTVKNIETTYYPNILKIAQRDGTFFDEDITFRSVNIGKIWREHEEHREIIWKNVLSCLLASFFHGDLKDKVGVVLNAVKGYWNGSGQENDELNRILNDESSEDHFKEILEYLQNTRIAKIFMEIVENVDVESLDLNFENPQEIIETIRNPENPKMKKIITKIQGLIQERMQRGEFTQQQIVGEIEGIKAKIQGLFGNVFNGMLGGHRADVPSNILMGNSPEARRQRMIARLQKRQRDKNLH